MEGKVIVGRFNLLKEDVRGYNITISHLRQQLRVHLRTGNRKAQHEVECAMFTLMCTRTAVEHDIAELEQRHQRRRS